MTNCNCNKCNPTRSCGCADSPDRTPCTYSDCSVGSERCSDIQCTECVSYCGTSFQVGTTGQIIKIETGDRLDSIIQKLALMLSQGVGACTADDLHHAPYNLYASTITNTEVTLVWNAESSLSTGINVYYDDGTGYVLANLTPIATGVYTYKVELLTPDKEYKIKLQSVDAAAAVCNSVELVVKTLL